MSIMRTEHEHDTVELSRVHEDEDSYGEEDDEGDRSDCKETMVVERESDSKHRIKRMSREQLDNNDTNIETTKQRSLEDGIP